MYNPYMSLSTLLNCASVGIISPKKNFNWHIGSSRCLNTSGPTPRYSHGLFATHTQSDSKTLYATPTIDTVVWRQHFHPGAWMFGHQPLRLSHMHDIL